MLEFFLKYCHYLSHYSFLLISIEILKNRLKCNKIQYLKLFLYKKNTIQLNPFQVHLFHEENVSWYMGNLVFLKHYLKPLRTFFL